LDSLLKDDVDAVNQRMSRLQIQQVVAGLRRAQGL
jgi:hypothetical protein